MQSLLFTLLDTWRAPAPGPERVGWLSEWDYAHRGLHGDSTPENSPSAFAEAIGRGLGIECDVQRTRDGQAVVFHDWELDRLTDETGRVDRRNAAEIEKILLSGSNDAIPQLGRLLEQVGGEVPILIELKSAFDRRITPLCLAVKHALEGYRGKYAVMSYDPRVSSWFHKNSPKTICGLVVKEAGRQSLKAKWERRAALWHAKPDFLAYDVRDLPSPFAAAQRKRGIPVLTWTVNTQELRETGLRHADALIAELESAA
ncbi:glycerophosphodiester phosphodiesterase family protein [Pontixanthobacter aestiaquae]|uniref:Glycerophosphodiester phosphodiesterase n=1 Tax=Pontixanthobacter aestiaquae TaxID=1509367 RepID=A0A844YZM9_9SPHN|nr:glycerophosphodiester phosphodiesterase family protein [Pontixanthobacter aestiaquae]MDN3647093.1 glycerophosphodiester phosphodiesterase family protein [Pontixanthobacter aestiaquae]MXO81931.1 glycerophosphodiester phosphodiesterase [Pontixanthobacter aestiaquae]